MGYLIATIQDAISGAHVELLSNTHKLQDPTIAEVRGLVEASGYELGDILAKNPSCDWPLTAIVYTSKDPHGVGRCGSKVYAYLVRRKEPHGDQ